MTESTQYPFTAAIVGGAAAGAEVADKLAARGALCVVFEQNDRPYGKVEDGLPAWHVGLRRKEYDLIDAKLTRPGVHLVPRTRIGRDTTFHDLVARWGFDAIILAHGAWRDRPLPVAGADAFIDKGLVYQNSFIYWFNHHRQKGYRGPAYEVSDGAIVVGGGLASIDVVKVLQLELTLARLAERGIDEDLVEMETDGIPAVLEKHGLRWSDLKLDGCTLYYRRRMEDMPLAEAAPGATPEQLKKTEAVRKKILEKARGKYLFRVAPLLVPTALLTEGDRLVGLKFARTRVDERGKAVEIPDDTQDVFAPLIISSIGSIPEPMDGLAMSGELLRLRDPETGQVEAFDNVFSCGNVVTGKGNLVASRKHGAQVANYVCDRFTSNGRSAPATGAQTEALLARVRERQRAVGYDGDYKAWIRSVTPPDFV